jgi:hypothetical protein
LLAALLIAGPATSGASAAGLPAPFFASVSGVAQLTSPSTGTFTGSGFATYLGYVRETGGVVAHFDQPSSTCANGFASTNTETFTARSGDTLSLESTDVTCPIGDPRTTTQFRGTGHWVVTGGTGRYADVTGSGRYAGYANFGHRFRFVFSGRITRP